MTDCYTVILSIDDPMVEELRASGKRVVVARHGPTWNTKVAWLVWDASPTITVTWNDQYGVFAARPSLQQGTQIEILHELDPAQPSAVYTFSGDGFSPAEPGNGVLGDHYNVRNTCGTPAAFGLVQSGVVNGERVRGPLNAVVSGDAAAPDFERPTSISIWLGSDVAARSVVRIPDDAATFDVSRKGANVSYRYDLSVQAFVSAESDAAAPRPWSTSVPFVPSHQKAGMECAPATAEMILSSLGYRTPQPVPDQIVLFGVIQTHQPANAQFGHPDGVSFAINDFEKHNVIGPPRTYVAVRRDTQDAVRPVMAASLLANEAVGLTVHNGTHWIVLYGGDGKDVSTIDHLLVCDPLGGQVNDLVVPPVSPVPKNFLKYSIPFANFVVTYRFKVQLENAFVMVADQAADSAARTMPVPASLARELARLDAQDAVAAVAEVRDERTIQQSIDAVLRSPRGKPLEGGVRRRPRRVRRASNAFYWLVPFVMPDRSTNVLRLGSTGSYLGIAYDVWYSDLYADEAASAFTAHMLREELGLVARAATIRKPARDLVWHPTKESRNPFNPFYVFGEGDTRTYVSVGGYVTTELRDIATYEVVSIE